MQNEPRRRGAATLAVLAVIVTAGLGVRLGYAIDQPAQPPPDAVAYARIAANLHAHGNFDARPPGARHEVQPSSAYSPGLPLLVAGLYFLSGGEHETLALVILALIGSASIPLAYLLAERLASPVAGLIAAAALAAYPALIEYQGLLLTEPLASTLLVAALVTYTTAASSEREAAPGRGRGGREISGVRQRDRPGSRGGGVWFLTGFLLGLLALVRPEYLVLCVLLPAAWGIRMGMLGSLRGALPALGLCLLASVLVLAPWTVRNAIVLDRFVPLSTGGGKALFIGTYLDAHGDSVELRELLLSRRPALRARLERGGPIDDPGRYALERVLDRLAAERYPGLETDAALARMGRQNLGDDVTEEPIRFAGMLAEKSYATWTDSARATMQREPWRALQLAVVIFSLIGLAFLVVRRRFEAVPIAIVLVYMTAVAALLISSPRRELVVMPLLAALAGVGATGLVDSLARWRR